MYVCVHFERLRTMAFTHICWHKVHLACGRRLGTRLSRVLIGSYYIDRFLICVLNRNSKRNRNTIICLNTISNTLWLGLPHLAASSTICIMGWWHGFVEFGFIIVSITVAMATIATKRCLLSKLCSTNWFMMQLYSSSLLEIVDIIATP